MLLSQDIVIDINPDIAIVDIVVGGSISIDLVVAVRRLHEWVEWKVASALFLWGSVLMRDDIVLLNLLFRCQSALAVLRTVFGLRNTIRVSIRIHYFLERWENWAAVLQIGVYLFIHVHYGLSAEIYCIAVHVRELHFVESFDALA